jgi:hypothetical protein
MRRPGNIGDKRLPHNASHGGFAPRKPAMLFFA